MGIASMVLGILSLIGSFSSVSGSNDGGGVLFFSILGLVFGAVGIAKGRKTEKGIAFPLSGLIFSILATGIMIYLMVVGGVKISGSKSDNGSDKNPQTNLSSVEKTQSTKEVSSQPEENSAGDLKKAALSLLKNMAVDKIKKSLDEQNNEENEKLDTSIKEFSNELEKGLDSLSKDLEKGLNELKNLSNE